MSFFLTCTPHVLDRCDLTRGSRWELFCKIRTRSHPPAINHGHPPFIENKRYRLKPRGIGDVVNRKAVSVYQTDAVLILIGAVQERFESGALQQQCQQDETVQSTSMFKTMSLALLASVSWVGAGLSEAWGIEATA